MPFRPADNSPFRRHYAPMGATRRSLLCLCMCDGFSIAHRRENARIIAEAPPVAEKARRFRGSVPVFTPQRGWKPADTTVFRIAKRRRRRKKRGDFEEVSRFSPPKGAGNRLTRRCSESPKRRRWRRKRGDFEEVSRFSRPKGAGNRLTRRCSESPKRRRWHTFPSSSFFLSPTAYFLSTATKSMQKTPPETDGFWTSFPLKSCVRYGP